MPSSSKIAGQGNVDSVVDSIEACQTIVLQDKIGDTFHEATTSPMRHANRFEYLAIFFFWIIEYLAISEALTEEVVEVASTDASTVAPKDEGVDVGSTGTVIPDAAEYSDSSPICDSFKQVKRIDELEFTPHPLRLSKANSRD